jgi:peptidyl-tRNA hydrolase, PTH1 family
LPGQVIEKNAPFCLLGLGNPGRAYERTRHNLGFMVVDALAGRWGGSFKKGFGPYDAFLSKRGGGRTILAKPTTFMNNSGAAAGDLIRRYEVPLERFAVLSDDFNLALGRIRIRAGGSDGGHQGLASVIRFLGTQEFPRIRLGIGLEPGANVIHYVLARFAKSEKKAVDEMVERAADACEALMEHGLEWTMNRFNRDS